MPQIHFGDGQALRLSASCRNADEAAAGCAFEPPYTSMHCGVISGGTAHNIMAHHCRFVTDIRAIPGENAMDYFSEFEAFARDEVEPEMQASAADTGIEFKINAQVPSFEAAEESPAVMLVKRLTGQNLLQSVSYGAEAGQFQEAGHSVVMCGPGSIDQAHQADEYISLAQVEESTAFTRRLIDYLS